MKQILGYGDDEGYNVYSEPWRKESNLASNIYRPGKNIDKEAYGGQEDLDEFMKEVKDSFNRMLSNPTEAHSQFFEMLVATLLNLEQFDFILSKKGRLIT